MYSVCVSTTFDAVHAVTVRGIDEASHNHTWIVELQIEGKTLDEDGLLIDFLEVEKCLKEILEPLRNSNLNELTLLERKNPSAEYIAFYIYKKIIEKFNTQVRVQSVTVTEAPNCKVTYTP